MSEAQIAATAAGMAVSGALDVATAARAYQEGCRLLRTHAVRQIDVSAVSSIDSSGLAVLLAWQAAGGEPRAQVVGLGVTGRALARVGGVVGLLEPATDGSV